MWSQVEPYRHNTVFVLPRYCPVEIEVTGLAYSFKFDEYFFDYFSVPESEILAIPYHCVRQLFDRYFEGFVFIKGMR